MREDTKAKFDRVLQTYAEKASQAQRAVEKKQTARQTFEIEWRKNRDSVVQAALDEVAQQVLRPRGWQCHIKSSDAEHAITLEVYQGDMTGATVGRPHIQFKADKTQTQVHVYVSTQSQGGVEGTVGVPITAEVVDEYVLRFIERLAGEGPRHVHVY